MIWFTGDLHFGQNNIVTSLSKWGKNAVTREFNSSEHMDWTIINNINDLVDGNDLLFILGDIALSRKIDINFYFDNITCNNLYWIPGNHDDDLLKDKKFCERFKKIESEMYVKYRVKDFEKLGHNKNQSILLSHYAMRVWRSSHKGSWMLYGHSHTSLDVKAPSEHSDHEIRNLINMFYAKKKTMDCGIDNAYRLLGEYRPFEIEEINNVMKDREILYIDHHEKRP